MASLNLFTPPIVAPQRRVHTAATSAKGAGGAKEEKSLLDFILGSLTKQDQFYETDPILQRADEKTGGTTTTTGKKGTVSVSTPKKGEKKSGGTTSGRKGTVVVSPPKNTQGGGFGGLLGGLFSKED